MLHRPNHCIRSSIILFLLLGIGAITPQATADDFFEKQVRPILAERCFECHSGTSEKIHGNLRVDHGSFLRLGGESGTAIVPGKASESLLYRAVMYDGYEMPPNSKLPDAEVEILKKWIDLGAEWPDEPIPDAKPMNDDAFDLDARKGEHWVWQPIVAPAIPKTKFDEHSRNAVDQFIHAEIQKAGLMPDQQAPRAILIRRLFLDLVGLPPTMEELKTWEESRDANWYELMLDRLLADPQFGVRWGRHWLDLVRFANSRGHEFDEDIPAADEYRDYVVRAFNDDVPYDQLVREHIAGDLIREPRTNRMNGWNESLIGTGFWHLGEWVHSPVDSRKDETDRFDNMVDVYSKTFLGLTIACARCHDHKFDAIKSEDYYAMYGYLRSSDYRLVRYETDLQHRRISGELATLRKTFRQELRHALEQTIENERTLPVGVSGASEPASRPLCTALESLTQKFSAEKSGKPIAGPLATDDPRVQFDARRADLRLWQSDGVVFGTEPAMTGQIDLRAGEDTASFEIHRHTEATRDPFWNPITHSIRTVNQQNRFAQVNEAGKLFPTPAFTLETDQVSFLIRGSVRAFVSVDSLRLIAGPLHGETVLDSVGPQDQYRWVTQSLGRYRGKAIHIEFAPIDDKPCSIAQVILGPAPTAVPFDAQTSTTPRGLACLNDFSSWLSQTNARLSDALDETFAQALEQILNEPNKWLGADHQLAKKANRIRAEWKIREQEIAKSVHWNSKLTLAMRDGTGQDDTLLIRGNPSRIGKRVPRRNLLALGGDTCPVNDPGSGRLALAEQLIAPDNPLVARVFANRIWHHLMGRGIVATTDDFGVLGARPSHPELLDYLAVYLRESGWSTKSLIRHVCLSATYRRDSRTNATNQELDPANLLLSHARVRRLEAEPIRDSLLAISGQLDARIGGYNVPVFLNEFLDGRGRPGKSGPIDGAGRRSLFLEVRRNFVTPMLTTFDTPTPFSSMGRRNVSNVPAQSLILLNDPLVHRLAEKWAERELLLVGDDASRIERMLKTAIARGPTSAELESSLAFVRDPSFATPADAWRSYAHMLLNNKELLFRY